MTVTAQELFNNSRVRYPFWSDEYREEDPEQLRLAVAETTAGLENRAAKIASWKERTKSLSLLTVFFLIIAIAVGIEDFGRIFILGVLICISGTGYLAARLIQEIHDSAIRRPFNPRLHANSKARFASWLAALESKDPIYYKEIIDWFEAEARKAQEELARRYELSRAELAQRQQARGVSRKASETSGVNTGLRDRFSEQEKRARKASEGPTRGVGPREAESQMATQSSPGFGQSCAQPGCTQEPMNQFGGPELCGGHTLVMIDPNNEVHGAGYGPWG